MGETLDNRAVCNAKDKLETCLEIEAPNCEITVTSPAQATLIAARQTSPDEVCFHISKGYVRCISFVLSLAMSCPIFPFLSHHSKASESDFHELMLQARCLCSFCVFFIL